MVVFAIEEKISKDEKCPLFRANDITELLACYFCLRNVKKISLSFAIKWKKNDTQNVN